MLIPLGFLAASGGLASDYEHIATAFGTGSSGVITFSSIPQNYKHLQIRWASKSSGNTDVSLWRFNNDVNTNYAFHQLYGSNTGIISSGTNPTTAISPSASSSQSTVTQFAIGVMDILDYTAAKNKTTRALLGDVNRRIVLSSGLWMSTTAISTISITLGGSQNFQSPSRFSLYGLKG